MLIILVCDIVPIQECASSSVFLAPVVVNSSVGARPLVLLIALLQSTQFPFCATMVAVWLALVASALFAQSPAFAAENPKFNGWYPCHDTMAYPKATPPTIVALFECAEVKVSLCHERVCTKTINLFVKWLLAKMPTTPRKVMWFLQGGPGYASTGNMYCAVRCTWRV